MVATKYILVTLLLVGLGAVLMGYADVVALLLVAVGGLATFLLLRVSGVALGYFVLLTSLLILGLVLGHVVLVLLLALPLGALAWHIVFNLLSKVM